MGYYFNSRSIPGMDKLEVTTDNRVIKIIVDISSGKLKPLTVFTKESVIDRQLIIQHPDKDNIFRIYSVGYLKALAYVSNPNNYKYVRYKDNDVKNLDISNLEWVNSVDRNTLAHAPMDNIKVVDVKENKTYYFTNLREVSEYLRINYNTVICIAKQSMSKPYKEKFKIFIPEDLLINLELHITTIYVYDHLTKKITPYKGLSLASYHTGINKKVVNIGANKDTPYYHCGYSICRVASFTPVEVSEDTVKKERLELYSKDGEIMSVEGKRWVEAYDYKEKVAIRATNEYKLGEKIGLNVGAVTKLINSTRNNKTIALHKHFGFRASDCNYDWIKDCSPYKLGLSIEGKDTKTKMFKIESKYTLPRLAKTLTEAKEFSGLSFDNICKEAPNVGDVITFYLNEVLYNMTRVN